MVTLNFKIIMRVLNWFAAWIDIVCALINILTFTLYRPNWDMGFRASTSKIILKRKMQGKT